MEIIEEHEKRSLAEVWSGYTHFQDRDVIFAKITPCMENGKIAVARDLKGGIACGSTEFHVIRPCDDILSDYIWYFLRQKSFRHDAEHHMTGTVGQRRVPKSYLENYAMPLPPVKEQCRIVSKLDSLFARSKAARDELARVPVLIEHYKQAILEKAFSGELVGDRHYHKMVPISQYVLELDQGWSPKCEPFSRTSPDKWAVLKTTAVQPIHFVESENKQLPSHLLPRPTIEVNAGDVLITRAGPRSRVGITCVVREASPRLMLADKIYRLKLRRELANPIWVAFMLNAPQAMAHIERMKTGISDSGLNLTQEKFLNLSLPRISILQQDEVVCRIEAAMAWLNVVATEQGKASQLLDHLDQGLLAKAFRGELVPQDPSDESAEKLLERIRATRGAQPKPRRGRRASAGAAA